MSAFFFATFLLATVLARSGSTFTFPNISEQQYIGYGTGGQFPLDYSNIRFQNEESLNEQPANTIWESHIDRIISRGVVQLALQLNHVMDSQGKSLLDERNIVFSPTSIASALALVLLGSSGRTRDEIGNVLGLAAGVNIGPGPTDAVHQHFGRLLAKLQVDPSESLDVYTASASAVFVQENFPVKEHYRTMARDIYNSEIVSLDFITGGQEAKEAVNSWVSNMTRGLIATILDQAPSPQTRVIIASALYFNGAWEYTFPLKQTSWRPFHVGSGSNDEVLQVIMMKTAGEEMLYYEDKRLGCQIVGLPYKGGVATMYLVLPDNPGAVALRQFESQITPHHLQELADSAIKTSVIVALPRMRLESVIQLKNSLRTLGVISLFNPYSADLSELSDSASPASVDILDTRIIPEHENNTNANTSENTGESSAEMDENQEKQMLEEEDLTHDNATSVLNKTDCSQSNENTAEESNDTDAPNITALNERIEQTKNVATNRRRSALYADDVIHKVIVDVTETGTAASASTVVSLTRDGSHKVVNFNRPFLFFIRHESTKLMLFWGSVVRPIPNQSVR